MPPEFSRPLNPGRIGPEGRTERLEATEQERAALARRFSIPEVGRIAAEIRLVPEPGGSIRGTGRLEADVVQSCVVTLDPVPQRVEEAIDLRFLPPEAAPSDDPEGPDEIPMEAAVIDLGEAVAEQLALALDPFPRAPGAELPEDPSAGAEEEEALPAREAQRPLSPPASDAAGGLRAPWVSGLLDWCTAQQCAAQQSFRCSGRSHFAAPAGCGLRCPPA